MSKWNTIIKASMYCILFTSILLQACSDNECKSDKLIPWPYEVEVHEVTEVGTLSFKETNRIIPSDFFGTCPSGAIADSTGIVFGAIFKPNLNIPFILSFSWDVKQQWCYADSNFYHGMIPMLGGLEFNDEYLHISTGYQRIHTLNRFTGEYISTSTLSGDLGGAYNPNYTAVFSAGGLNKTENAFVFTWGGLVHDHTGICCSVYDKNTLSEIANFQRMEVEDRLDLWLTICITACTDSTIFMARKGDDGIYEYSQEGVLLRSLSCGKTAQREMIVPSIMGGIIYIFYPVIADLEFVPPDRLWVLYGMGAFPSDSSEIWHINLSTLDSWRLPLSGNVTGFCVWENQMVICNRDTDVNPETKRYDTERNFVRVGEWQYVD